MVLFYYFSSMKKMFFSTTLVLCGVFAFNCKAQEADGIHKMEISADAHGFMCPFLTPKFIHSIEQFDSCKVWKTDDLVIHLEFQAGSKINPEKILKLAEAIGYERNKIHVREN